MNKRFFYLSTFLGMTAAAALTAAEASAQEAPICTDRPTKANATCTVVAGAWQVEADGVNFTRNKAGGVVAKTTAYGATTVKYGLSDKSDLQVTWTPYVESRVTGANKISGSGDVYVRYKQALKTGGRTTVSVIPYVKIPTAADGLGNDEVEGGVALPVSVALDGFTLTFGPQADLLLDADGDGRHLAVTNLVNLARPISSTVTLYGELWTNTNFDPADTVTQFSADAAVVWLAAPTLQFDVGGNFGLNDKTPDAQVYVGVSKRF
ncbi:transporter [Caulobacter sp. 73W]|uniref:Transporter n=1 Tax=Caulobacter sp. 73W TaxID=3161137 RepID=A0AB39KZ20_9CAUL